MNKVILMGRLTRDPEIRYSQSAEPVAVTRYALAVNRSYKREGEPDADFINIVAFGKRGEFASKYFRKGQMVAVVGRLQVRSYDDPQTGQRKWSTDVIAEDQHFAESKASFQAHGGDFQPTGGNNQPNMDMSNQPSPMIPNNPNAASNSSNNSADGFYPIDEDLDDDDLPF